MTASSTDRKQDILKTAIELILAEGLASFTIRKVADAAGISTGLVLYHFETKDKLIEEAWRFAVQSLGERIDVSGRPINGREWMEAIFRVRFEEQDETSVPGLLWLEYWTHLARTPVQRLEHSQDYTKWREYDLSRLQPSFDAGILRPELDPTLIVDMFHTLVCGLLVKTAIDSETFTGERTFELGRFFLSLISAPVPSPQPPPH